MIQPNQKGSRSILRRWCYDLLILSPFTGVATIGASVEALYRQGQTFGLLSVSNMLWFYVIFLAWFLVTGMTLGVMAAIVAAEDQGATRQSDKFAIFVGILTLLLMLAALVFCIVLEAPPPQASGIAP